MHDCIKQIGVKCKKHVERKILAMCAPYTAYIEVLFIRCLTWFKREM